MRRRTFLKASAAAGALAAVSSAMPISLSNLEESRVKADAMKEEKWVNSFCTNCVGWCPLRVRVVNGKAVHVEGNPLSKTTGGKICPKGHLGLQQMYDPDRIKGPMKRTNPKKGKNEDPQFVPISWDEALETVANKMKELRNSGNAHKVVLNRGRYNTLDVHLLYERFCKVYGTPNNISHSSICAEATKQGRQMADGVWDYVGIDLERTNYLLCFGMSPLEAHRPYTRLLNAFGKVRDRANRIKMVVVDPRMSVSAAKADEWVALNPGTDGALANAIAHVILTEGLWDKNFVGDFVNPEDKFTTGKTIMETSGTNEAGEPIPTFVENETHGLIKWWNMVLKDATPEWAADITGISADRIIKIAKEFATTKPAYAWSGRGTGMRPNGAYCTYSVYVLNGLVGSIDVPGGIIYPSGSTYAEDPIDHTVVMDDIANKGLEQPRIDNRRSKQFPNAGVVTAQLGEAILNEDPYNVEMILAYFNNFTFSIPNTKVYEEAYAKVPFIVHITPMMAELTTYADIILPTPTSFEKWNYTHPVKSGLYAETRISTPVVQPLYDTMQTADITLELAKRIGGSVAKTFEGVNVQEYIKARLGEMQSWDEWMEKGIHVKDPYKIGSTREIGFPTPTGKFEFFANTTKLLFEERGISVTNDADMARIKVDARGDLVYLPHWEKPKDLGTKEEYPLLLISYKSALAGEGRTANNPWAQDRFLVQYGAGNTTFAEINPDTAEKWGINEGDLVKVSSLFGEVQCQAKLSEGIHPDILAMVYGNGHWAYGRFAKDKGVNPNDLKGTDYEYISGSSSYYNTRVKVTKV
ncbi:molybdopterin-dependent oxidoreductase [Anaerobacillus sp. CMMVII]|uniref:molybdopterin-containing oxidoreductase family protein n=1 Tax=Anaerobacillus sp. CMMVII TaxID=2755588 RepID=UPI0021B845EA|nr:molybdopterin-dependent oxidoreductase [Anaerobacillus sp. CMMVII]MCT8137014.1 molybdopterin-dependent oxidoreductase [Anaerobacillus sp. CMMVII]